MENIFQSKSVPRGTRTIWRYLSALLILLFSLSIGQMWADTEVFGFTCTSSTTAKGSYTATGGTAECKGSAMSTGGSNEITVGTQTFYKFSSSSEWVFTLSSGEFAVGDVISFTCACTTSNKTGKGVAIQTSPVIAVTGDFPKNESNTISYTVKANDGIAGESSFSIKRNDSDIKFGTISVTRSGGDTPVCPSGLSISSKDSKTAFTEGDAVELTAALTAGNGTITYQWYKGGTAEGNKLTGKTAAKLEIASCVEGDAGDYYCVASKSDCSDAVNADAFTITVAHNPCATHHWFVATADATANSKTNWDGFTNAPTGSNNQSNSVTIDGSTYTLTKRTGSTGGGGTILGFTIPANKAGTLYGYMKSSGTAARTLSLKKGDDVVKTNTEITDGNWTLITISAIAPGTYTLSPDANVQIQMFALKVCDATFHTITLDLAGGTGETSIQALDGVPATKPADPTKEHCAFDGWYNGASPYDWTANVSSNLTLTAHWTQLYTISFAAGEGSGDAPAAIADKANGETFTVPANTFTAPASKEFDKWNDGSADYAPGATYTVGTANVVLTAIWKAAVAKYTVIYMDGAVEMGRESVDVGSHPTASAIDITKPLYTFSNWKNASDEPVNLADVSGAKDEEITVYAEWNKVYAQDADLEGLVESEGTSADWQAYLTGKGYSFETEGDISLDSKASGKTYENWPYQGLKMKKVGAYVEGRIAADKLVIIKLGHMAAAANVSLDGVAAGTATGLDAAEPAGKLNYFYVENESVLRYETTNAGACILKAITIQDPFQVLFDENGGDPVAPQFGHPSVTLPSASKGTSSLLGWFDDATAGNKIGEPGDSYTPTGNITLYAHWEDVSTDARISAITLNPSTGTWEPAFDPEVVNYTYTMPYGSAVVPQIESAVKYHPMASNPVIDVQASAWGETAQVHGVAQSGDTKNYYIQMLRAPKDGVEIIRATHTGAKTADVTGAIGGTYEKNTEGGGKLGSNGHFFGIKLAEGTFQAGDLLKIHATTTSPLVQIFSDKGETVIDNAGAFNAGGDYFFTLSAATEWIYLYRTSTAGSSMNPVVEYMAVYRPMNPVLTSISFNSTDVAVTGTTVSALLPNGTNLGTMTVTPTIVWNGPGTAAVTGSWAWGANTYVVTDKDGDATTYTITLTEDELKHTVSFNTHGGSTIDPVQVVDGQKLAAAPADPTKEDYIFQGWAETEDGDIVDVTSFTITADKEFHAVWVADGAIKLLDGSTVNHTNFITAVTADETVEFQGNTVNYAKFSGTVSGVSSVKDLTRVIAYNATTNKTKIQISAHNNSTSARNILVKGLVEGASAAVDLATVALGNKEDKVSDWIEFDNAANRTIYIMVSSSAGDVYFTQVKVIESGETPMKQAGEIGYSLNLNKGRFFGPKETDLAFEGLNAELSGDYTALNSGYAKLTSTSMSFTVASAMTLSVTTNNNKTYYVTKDAAGTDNETAKAGVSEFDLTAGTWFITADVAEVQITNISFAAPKCEKPAIVDMSDVDLCDGDPYTALAVSASVSDGGTLHYAWFKEAGATDEAVGTDAASYTPDADGEYYVIVTNQKDGFADNTETSNAVTVQHLAGTTITTAPANVRKDEGEAATLTVVAAGKNLSYEWFTCNADGTGAEPLEPAATEASLDVTVPDGEQYYKVVVTGDCGTVEAIAKVEEWVELPQLDVTESTVWDWTYAGENNKLADGAGKNVDIVMANIRANDKIPTNDATFNSQALLFYGENVRNVESGRAYASIGHIKFNTTVPGVVVVEFSDNGSNNRRVSINGNLSESSASKTDVKTFSAIIPTAGEVEIMGVKEDGTGSNQYIRISKIEFVKVDYTREIRPGYFGTICLPNGGKMYGAALYEVAYFNGSDKIYFDEIVDGTMEPGMPYIFQSEGGSTALAVAYSEETPAEAKNKNGLYGSYTQEELTPNAGNYVLLNNQYLFVDNTNVFVGANRAYIRLENIPTTATAPAPGRRRVMMSVNSKNTPTGLEMTNDQSQMTNKVLIDGQIYILRGEKMYDATGRLVK